MKWFLILLVLFTCSAGAVQPDEMLANPALEARARSLSEGYRCLVCQNQSIDESDAPLARDLRILIRERLTAGDTDQQITQFIVARYGDYVLLKPRLNFRTALLWGTPFAALLAGLAFAWSRRQAAGHDERPLNADEQARLRDL